MNTGGLDFYIHQKVKLQEKERKKDSRRVEATDIFTYLIIKSEIDT